MLLHLLHPLMMMAQQHAAPREGRPGAALHTEKSTMTVMTASCNIMIKKAHHH
jgi:hypothetical protein